jgi:hypothetical protein
MIVDADKHKIRVDANLCGKLSRIYIDDIELMDVYAFEFRVDAESLTQAVITMTADVELNGTLMSEYFKVLMPTKPAGFWRRLVSRVF